MKKISISAGNAKMGAIPSVSLPACTTCNPEAPCFKKCYARRIEARRASVREAYARNLDVLREDPRAYWIQVRAAACVTRFFRFHVSGDIPGDAYFMEMVNLAEALPNTIFLAFTKQYNIVNRFVDAGLVAGNLRTARNKMKRYAVQTQKKTRVFRCRRVARWYYDRQRRAGFAPWLIVAWD